jgi:hypothetical protein
MRDRVVRRRRKHGSRLVRYLSLSVVLLGAWVVSVNTVLTPFLATPADQAERMAAAEDAGALASAPAVLPMLTAPAIPQLAAATQPITTVPVTRAAAGTLPAPAEETNSPAETATISAPVKVASADGTIPTVATAPASQSVRLASAAPTVGGADISDAVVIAKAVEPPTAKLAPVIAPLPRHRPRFAAVPLPRPRPYAGQVARVSFLERIFGAQ